MKENKDISELAKELENVVNYSLDGADCVDYNFVARHVRSLEIKARIEDREATKVLMEYSGDTELWYEDNIEKLSYLKAQLKEATNVEDKSQG